MRIKSKIKKAICALCTALLLVNAVSITTLAAPVWPGGVSISAEGGIVMEAKSGTVLYGKNENVQYFPASITKIMTALLVLENCTMDEMVTFSYDAVYNVERGSKHASLDEGDQLSVKDCLYTLLLHSANEVANALAEHIAGSRKAFAEMMNEKARSLGCTNTNFTNPSGLNDPEHYTTAYDMALIAKAAYENEAFVEIDSTVTYKLPATKLAPEGQTVTHGHKMMKQSYPQQYDSSVIGGKTGYTSLAGNTLVTIAEKNGLALVVVILNGHQTHYVDTQALLSLGFDNFENYNIAQNDTKYQDSATNLTISGLPSDGKRGLSLDKSAVITLPVGAVFSDAVSELDQKLPAGAPKDVVARLQYLYDGRFVGQAYLLAESQSAVGAEMITTGSPEVKAEEEKPKSGFGIVAGILVVLVLAGGGTAAVMVRRNRMEAEASKRRRQARLARLREEGVTEEELEVIRRQRGMDKKQ